jgi:protein gp37
MPRIEELRNTPAAIKFLSIEPLLENLGEVNFKGIDWVIVGGESGWGARKLEETWVQSLLKQCRTQHVQFFFKQWGGVKKKSAGRTLNGRTYDELPLLR